MLHVLIKPRRVLRRKDIKMKKIVSIILACSLVLALCAACGNKKEQTPAEAPAEAPTPTADDPKEPEVVLGGWSIVDDTAPTDEAKAALSKALEKLVGANYEAVALLETQVVAGTNYLLLCKITPVVPNPSSHYGIVSVYADLQGGAEITQIADTEFGIPGEVMPGGWYESVYDADDDTKAIVENAASKLVGAKYEAVCHVAEQVVAGKNHVILCRITPVVPNATYHYGFAVIYEDLQGNCELSDVYDFK